MLAAGYWFLRMSSWACTASSAAAAAAADDDDDGGLPLAICPSDY